jgi:hypothetical protein
MTARILPETVHLLAASQDGKNALLSDLVSGCVNQAR